MLYAFGVHHICLLSHWVTKKCKNSWKEEEKKKEEKRKEKENTAKVTVNGENPFKKAIIEKYNIDVNAFGKLTNANKNPLGNTI